MDNNGSPLHESLEDTANLPDPDELAAEIVEDLQRWNSPGKSLTSRVLL